MIKYVLVQEMMGSIRDESLRPRSPIRRITQPSRLSRLLKAVEKRGTFLVIKLVQDGEDVQLVLPFF